MVEFVLVLPVVITMVFLVIQLGITFNNYLRVTDAARVAAREAVVARFHSESACDAATTAAIDASGGLDAAKLGVACSAEGAPGEPFSVTVRYPWRVSLPLLPISSSGDLVGKATERLE
jgi:Flp pilus assembly protein TadG